MQGLFFEESLPDPIYSDLVEIDLQTIEPSIAGPKRPQDRIALSNSKSAFKNVLNDFEKNLSPANENRISIDGNELELSNGSIAIASITSCTNTSN